MKDVTTTDFRTPVSHTQVTEVVFRGNHQDGQSTFLLGFNPGAEFLYRFAVAPDVFFRALPIREVYVEPYRTFLRLSTPVTINVHYHALEINSMSKEWKPLSRSIP